MNAYTEKNPMRIPTSEERKTHIGIESGRLAGKSMYSKERMIVLKNKAFYQTDEKEVSNMQAKMNAITKHLSPKEREGLKEIIDWCGKEKAKSHYYEKLAGGFIKEN